MSNYAIVNKRNSILMLSRDIVLQPHGSAGFYRLCSASMLRRSEVKLGVSRGSCEVLPVVAFVEKYRGTLKELGDPPSLQPRDFRRAPAPLVEEEPPAPVVEEEPPAPAYTLSEFQDLSAAEQKEELRRLGITDVVRVRNESRRTDAYASLLSPAG